MWISSIWDCIKLRNWLPIQFSIYQPYYHSGRTLELCCGKTLAAWLSLFHPGEINNCPQFYECVKSTHFGGWRWHKPFFFVPRYMWWTWTNLFYTIMSLVALFGFLWTTLFILVNYFSENYFTIFSKISLNCSQRTDRTLCCWYKTETAVNNCILISDHDAKSTEIEASEHHQLIEWT